MRASFPAAARAGAALLGRLLRPLLGYALPPRCPGCGEVVQADRSFCLPCWFALDFLAGPACERCAEPLPAEAHPGSSCGACLADPPPFAALRAGVAYGAIARALALKLKYGRRPGVAAVMAGPMLRAGGDLLPGALVVPVPLHRWRLWRRDYNQAALIARALVRRGGGELAVDLLERRRATAPLRGLGRGARTRAVGGAFAVRADARTQLRGRRVVLVDDVYTSGATARACARALTRAGAGEVGVLCWARVVQGRADAR